MQRIEMDGVSIAAPQSASIKSLPMNFMRRLLWSLPLMIVAGVCLFGFVATFEPMPRIEQWMWRATYVGAGVGSVCAICWLWLRPQRQQEETTWKKPRNASAC